MINNSNDEVTHTLAEVSFVALNSDKQNLYEMIMFSWLTLEPV